MVQNYSRFKRTFTKLQAAYSFKEELVNHRKCQRLKSVPTFLKQYISGY